MLTFACFDSARALASRAGIHRLRMPSRVTPILLLSIVGVCLASPPIEAVDTVLVPTGAVWRYLDNGTNQNTAWRAAGFDDSSWAQGPAELGYGDGDEATIGLVRRQRQQQVRHHLLPPLLPGQRRRRPSPPPRCASTRRRRRGLPQQHGGLPHQSARRDDQLHHAGDQRVHPRTRSSRPRSTRRCWSRAPTCSRSRSTRPRDELGHQLRSRARGDRRRRDHARSVPAARDAVEHRRSLAHQRRRARRACSMARR